MAICTACNCDMLLVDDCSDNRTIKYADGLELPSSTYHFNEPNGRCHDCGIKHGNYHHDGCDVEQCPRCKEQLISCACVLEGEDSQAW
jgi:hypothetical protein